MIANDQVGMLTVQTLSQLRSVRHGFFTRQGGTSRGPYASLNCGLGSNDDRQCVLENRSRALGKLAAGKPCKLVSTYQIHSANVVQVEASWSDDVRPRADGMVTNVAGVALGILTADCAPVLFADATAGVIGAAHAGWRGARAGIIEETVASMCDLGAHQDDMIAAVGPCIAQPSYEVGPEFRESFTRDDPSTVELFEQSDRSSHFRFDLKGYVHRRLKAAGIKTVNVLEHDTCADEASFFSFRRTTLHGGNDYGRLLSGIALLDNMEGVHD